MSLISVVIAACDRPQTLGVSINSALASGEDVEIIVMDDSPTRSARPIVEALRHPAVHYHANPAPTGGRPAVVRNLGWRLAKGEFVHFLDDDDIVDPGHYGRAQAAFAASDVGVVFGRIEPFGDAEVDLTHERRYFNDAQRRSIRCSHFGPRWGFTAAMLFRSTLLVCGAGMVRRTLIPAIEGFDERLPILEDVDFYMRAIRAGGARFIDMPALEYRIGPSLMRAPNRQPKIDESYQMTHARYRAQHGLVEFFCLKLAAKFF